MQGQEQGGGARVGRGLVFGRHEVELVPGAEGPVGTVRLRAKPPTPAEGEDAVETAYPLDRARIAARFDAAPGDLQFAVAVTAIAEKLRHSEYAKDWAISAISAIAHAAPGSTPERKEFVELLDNVAALAK